MRSRHKHVTLPRLARDERMRTLDERIGGMMRAAEESGELRAAKSWGKPLDVEATLGFRLDGLARSRKA